MPRIWTSVRFPGCDVRRGAGRDPADRFGTGSAADVAAGAAGCPSLERRRSGELPVDGPVVGDPPMIDILRAFSETGGRPGVSSPGLAGSGTGARAAPEQCRARAAHRPAEVAATLRASCGSATSRPTSTPTCSAPSGLRSILRRRPLVALSVWLCSRQLAMRSPASGEAVPGPLLSRGFLALLRGKSHSQPARD